MSDATLLITLLALPFIGSVAAAFLPVNARNAGAWLSAITALSTVFVVAACFQSISVGTVLQSRFDWLPQFGLYFSLRMDGFAWLFAFLVVGIGLLVVRYAHYYMSSKDPVPRFFSFLLAFMGSMLGVVLSGNLI